MNKETLDLSSAILPKSDQLNADDLLVGPITVDILDVNRGNKEQPVVIVISGRQPYKPCKSMCRVLISAWGNDGKSWIGRSMTLYCDPSVKFGGVALGGIRISHLSDIGKTLSMMLTKSRGRKEQFTVNPIITVDHAEIIDIYKATADGEGKTTLWESLTVDQQEAIHKEFNNLK